MTLNVSRILAVGFTVAALVPADRPALGAQAEAPGVRLPALPRPGADVAPILGQLPQPFMVPALPPRGEAPQPLAAPPPTVPFAMPPPSIAVPPSPFAAPLVAAQDLPSAVDVAQMAETIAAAQAVAADAAAIHVDRAELARVTAEARAMAARVRAEVGALGWSAQTVAVRSGDQEIRLYNEGRAAIDKAQWERAIERYAQVVELKGPRADAALYWKAFAQDRQGQRAEALATIGALVREHPSSRYLQQAKVLEAEIRQKSGQPVRPQDQSDEDLKLMALNALQHTAPEQAVPMLEKLLHGTASPRLKERALFVLAQSNTPQAREALKSVAKGSSIPELQNRAILYLAQHGGPESRAVLAEVYGSAADVDVKRGILRAYMVSGDRERLFAAAQGEKDPQLRAEAVRQLGTMNAHAELAQLYQRETGVDIRKQIIRAMFVGGDVSRMIELAKTEKDPELRREAVRNLGQMGAKGPADALVDIYSSEKDPDVKRAVIQALGNQNNATALVTLARKEQDPAMRTEIVRRLSTMGNNKVATDYMLEILGGK